MSSRLFRDTSCEEQIRLVQVFEPELSDLHRQILDLIYLPADVF